MTKQIVNRRCATFSVSNVKNWFLMINSYASTPQVIKVLGIRKISWKVSFSCAFQKQCKIYSLDLTTYNYFWKVPISHIIENRWKRLNLLWALLFQFNCGAYPIVHLSSLKLLIDSKCIQASSSKNIFCSKC